MGVSGSVYSIFLYQCLFESDAVRTGDGSVVDWRTGRVCHVYEDLVYRTLCGRAFVPYCGGCAPGKESTISGRMILFEELSLSVKYGILAGAR